MQGLLHRSAQARSTAAYSSLLNGRSQATASQERPEGARPSPVTDGTVQRYITDSGGHRMSQSDIWEEIGEAVDGTPDEAELDTYVRSPDPYTLDWVVAQLTATHPTGISRTDILREGLSYGADFRQTLTSSTGSVADLHGMTCREVVTTVRIPERDLNIDAPVIERQFLINNNQGQFDDRMWTQKAVVDGQVSQLDPGTGIIGQFVSSQKLYWRDAQQAWHEFAEVPMVLGVVGHDDGSYVVYNSNNGKIATEPYTGPKPT